MSNYRKLIAAAVGIVAFYVQSKFQIDLGPINADIIEIIIGAGTLLGVERLPNTPRLAPDSDPGA